ncbi:MAG: response regulator transcription factor [Candidatus Promineifilaceae bacterium]|nr:response regulator transcription factor [Candidatus Promineifilaceae bacterium]
MTLPEATVLLLEGRGSGTNSLSMVLEKDPNLTVTLAHTGNAALEISEGTQVDLIIFDASTMRSSGIRTCARLRREMPSVPIIHCRPANQPENRSVTADVYLAFPFTARKLFNRVRMLLPADAMREEIVRAGDLTLFVSKRSVNVANRGEKRLTPKLVDLLIEFLHHPNEVLGREDLMRTVWQTDYVGDTRTLDVHIRWMREIIEEDPASPSLVRTVRGVGYIFSIPPKPG